jgi:hypothetical protein
MEPTSRPGGTFAAIRAVIETVLLWLRRIAGAGFSLLQRDSITSLRIETEELGSAAVVSATSLGAELRGIDERLTRLEEDLAAIRKLLEEREPVTGRTPD